MFLVYKKMLDDDGYEKKCYNFLYLKKIYRLYL